VPRSATGRSTTATTCSVLARRWLDSGVLQADYLYVDGHVKDYSGTRLVPEVWNSHRRMPLPGIVQYFVNDLREGLAAVLAAQR